MAVASNRRFVDPDSDKITHEPKRRASSILVVDDEPGIGNFLQRALSRQYGLVEVAESAEAADELRQRCHFDLLIVDIRLPGRSGLQWIADMRRQGDPAEVIFITAYGGMDSAIAALRTSAADFIVKPFRIEQIMTAVERCLTCRGDAHYRGALLRRAHERAGNADGIEGVVGKSRAIREVCDIIKQVAPTPSSVLIEGETGTGKEIAARAIHGFSGRSGPFVPVNCVAISPELFESELFGHAKGAFTSAHQSRDGLFSFASGGTLFLDEISEMSVSMQAKLLRVLESRTIRPVGSDRELAVDVRVVAASNKDLAERVAQGRFREDLYYRLNVVTLRMPALRDRPEDIPELFMFFSRKLALELGVVPLRLGADEFAVLCGYEWPGNVRELRNLVERSLLLGRVVLDSPLGGQSRSVSEVSGSAVAGPAGGRLTLKEVEKRHLLSMLEATSGNKSEAARRLGISRKTLERKLCNYSDPPQGGADDT